MKYEYGLLYPPDAHGRYRKRPMIEVELRGPNGTFRELALVDSGADRSLVHREIADVLGLDYRQGERHKVIGVSGITDVWYAELEMRFAHTRSTLKIPVGIIDTPYVGVLLGQEGFFDHHRITFERALNTFTITQRRRR
jgi:aspartyl protease